MNVSLKNIVKNLILQGTCKENKLRKVSATRLSTTGHLAYYNYSYFIIIIIFIIYYSQKIQKNIQIIIYQLS